MAKYNVSEVEFEELRKEFEPVVGFLVVPDEKGTRKPCTFTGILREVFKYTDKRKKERAAAIFEAVENQNCVSWDKESQTESQVKDGQRIGVAITGALKSILPGGDEKRAKIGHMFYMDFTGELMDTEGGKMLIVKTKVSKKPVQEAEVPFEEPKTASGKNKSARQSASA